MNYEKITHKDSQKRCTFAADYVQTTIQQAPGARVPAFWEQRLLAVCLSGQGGGVQCALSSHTDIRLGGERRDGSRRHRLHRHHNSTGDDARGGQCDRLEGATDEESGCENGHCTGVGGLCAGSRTKCQRLTEIRRGRGCQATGTPRCPNGHLHTRRHVGADHHTAQWHQHL